MSQSDRFSLSKRFAAAGGIVTLLAMAAIGLWVTGRIEKDVIDNTASATALYMDSFIAPLAQELDQADALSPGPIRAIQEMLDGSALGERIVAVKIWKPDGLVAYSDEASIIGQRFPVSSSLSAALKGRVMAEFNQLGEAENVLERGKGLPLLEIYSPLRQAYSGRILGALEFYENATELEKVLDRTRMQSWAIVALVALAIGALLFGIVHRGSRLIERQRAALQARIGEIATVSSQNRELRLRVERAARQVAESNEQTLRRISAELHDGPKQLIGLAALRLDAVGRAPDKARRAEELAVVSDALGSALREISNLCNDLAVPEIEALTVAEVVRRVTGAHCFRTGTEVALDLDGDSRPVPQAVRICIYRFVQEGLNNAWRHANGVGQKVSASFDGSHLTVSVANAAGDSVQPAVAGGGLGLAGLRERVESLGGHFDFGRTTDGGAVTTMTLDIDGTEENNA